MNAAKPFKPFPLLEKDDHGCYKSLKFQSAQERDEAWQAMLKHYGCKETYRHGEPVVVIPKLITGAKSRYFRESGRNYARAKAYKLSALTRSGEVHRIDFTGNLSHREADALVQDCWGDSWPR